MLRGRNAESGPAEMMVSTMPGNITHAVNARQQPNDQRLGGAIFPPAPNPDEHGGERHRRPRA